MPNYLALSKETEEKINVYADDFYISQIITNYLTNAIKNAYGAEKTLKELLGFRADNEAAKNQAYSRLMNEGVVYLDELESYPEDRVAINTLDVYYTSAGMKTNIISGSKLISSPRENKKR